MLSEFAGEDTRIIWEEKILGLGSPLFDAVEGDKKEYMDIPETWRTKIQKEDGSYKKVILYHISLGAFLEHKERMLSKIESTLKTFKEQREEVTLLWMPHPLIQRTCKSIHPQLWEKYKQIINQYLEEDWGIYDDTEDLKRDVLLCDAYYGDSDRVAQQCKRMKKPVMLQSLEV